MQWCTLDWHMKKEERRRRKKKKEERRKKKEERRRRRRRKKKKKKKEEEERRKKNRLSVCIGHGVFPSRVADIRKVIVLIYMPHHFRVAFIIFSHIFNGRKYDNLLIPFRPPTLASAVSGAELNHRFPRVNQDL